MRSYLKNQFINLVWLTMVLGACLPGVSQAVPTCANPCVTQIYAGGGDPARTINIAYVSLGWPDVAASTYSSWVQNTMGFMSIEPFNLYSTYFNIYRVDINSSRSETDSAIKALALQQPQLPNVTQWIFIGNGETSTGCSGYVSGGDTFLFTGVDTSCALKTAAHELGHAIGGLADEYDGPCPPFGTRAEPWNANLTGWLGYPDKTTLKWKNWLSIDGVDAYPGSYCYPENITYYHPTTYSIMLGGLGSSTFDPVGREQMIWGMNWGIPSAFTSYSPSSLSQTASSTLTRLTAQLDPALRPQGASLGYQWYVTTPSKPVPTLVPGATLASYDFDSSFVGEGQTATVWATALDPDVNNYVRNEGQATGPFFFQGQGTLIAGNPLKWNFTRPGIPTTITSVLPPVGLPGEPILVRGTRLCPYNSCASTRVSINGGPAITPYYASDTLLAFNVPAGATTGQITVTTATGGTVPGGTFTVGPISWINSFSPPTGMPGEGVVVNGIHFCPNNNCSATRVVFNGVSITPNKINETQLVFVIPNLPTFTAGTLTVTTASGTGLPSAATFMISNAPWIRAVLPNRGKVGDVIQVQGRRFCHPTRGCSVTKVVFGGAGFITPDYVSNGLLTFTVPNNPLGAAPLTVSAGSFSNTVGFVVEPSSIYSPVITSIIPPATIPPATNIGQYVLVYGRNFCFQQCNQLMPADRARIISDS